jgi:hypothetical protein
VPKCKTGSTAQSTAWHELHWQLHLSTLLYSTFLTLKLSTVRLEADKELTRKLT